MAGEKIWYVRLEDGKAYGPADTASLISWAEDGRIGPEASVSQDRKSWQPILSMPELEMNWLVEVAPGEVFGPFNRSVVSNLFKKGSFAETTRVYRLHELPIDQDPPPIEKIVEKEVPVEVIKEVRVEVPVEKVVEKIVEKEVPVEKIVEKVVEKEVPVEVIKEVRVEVPVEKIVEKIVEKEVPVEKIVEKEVPVEVIKEVRVEVPVEKIVEKIVEKEVPVEVIKEVRVEVPVEKIVEKVVEKVIEVPVEVVKPEVVLEPVPKQPLATSQEMKPFGETLAGRRNSLAALEAAARRELAAARMQKKGFSFFGGK